MIPLNMYLISDILIFTDIIFALALDSLYFLFSNPYGNYSCIQKSIQDGREKSKEEETPFILLYSMVNVVVNQILLSLLFHLRFLEFYFLRQDCILHQMSYYLLSLLHKFQ